MLRFFAKVIAIFCIATHLYAANPQVKMTTNKGTIVLELFAEEAPITVDNFLRYVDDNFYAGTTFHRIIDGFMIQGGGFTEDFSRKETLAPIQNESANGVGNDRGTISMARTRNPHSATSQFFINLVDNFNLNAAGNRPGYAVFGKVVSGMDVVDNIAKVETGAKGGHRNVPNTPVVIQSVKRLAN